MKAMHKANNISTGLDENVTNLLYRLVKIRAKSPFTLYFNHKFVIFYTFLEFSVRVMKFQAGINGLM